MFKNKAKRFFRAAKLQHLQHRHSQQQQQQQQTTTGDHELDEQQIVSKQEYFDFATCHRTYSCAHCRAHLADHDQLISKLFQGNHGRAYLFNQVVNIGCKQAVQRELLTGLHAVADIYCDNCETTLGWKYEQAFVPSQKYKEGKYIIELVHMLKENNWDLTSYNARDLIRSETTAPKCGLSSSSAACALDTFNHQYKYPSSNQFTSAVATDRPCSVLIIPASGDSRNSDQLVVEMLAVETTQVDDRQRGDVDHEQQAEIQIMTNPPNGDEASQQDKLQGATGPMNDNNNKISETETSIATSDQIIQETTQKGA